MTDDEKQAVIGIRDAFAQLRNAQRQQQQTVAKMLELCVAELAQPTTTTRRKEIVLALQGAIILLKGDTA